MIKLLKLFTVILFIITLTACATSNPADPNDPYEAYNKNMFLFNGAMDHLYLKPISKVYQTITPMPLRLGINNALDNLRQPVNVINSLLQGKFSQAGEGLLRFIFNSTFGVLGLFDISTKLGLPEHYQDFGMTLSYWQDSTEPTYFILPLLGPNSVHSSIGLPVDYLMYPTTFTTSISQQELLLSLKAVTLREKYLAASDLVENAFDPYSFLRNAYLQHRRKQLADNLGQNNSNKDNNHENTASYHTVSAGDPT